MERPPTAAPKHDPPRDVTRLLAIDGVRGLALFLMALEHASFFAGVRTQAEHYVGRPTVLWKWPYFVTGLVTNFAPFIFWFVAGISVCLYAASKRRAGQSEASIARYFVIRGLVLLALDATLLALLNGLAHGGAYAYEVDVLTSVGISLIVGVALTRLPAGVLAAIGAALLLGYQALREAALAGGGPLPAWLAVWLDYRTAPWPAVRFPVLGWCGLFLLGLAAGRRVRSPGTLSPARWAVTGGALLLAWAGIRGLGGYGNFVPYDPAQPWAFFLVMSKGPPSLDFVTFNAGLAALSFAALLALPRSWLENAPGRWLVASGQASLFFYAAHHVVYLGIARGLPWIQSLPGLVRYALLYALGILVLVPLTQAYRRWKKRYPESFLQYL